VVKGREKIRGFRIELSEIESAINSCNNLKTSVVLAKTDEDGNKQLISYIIPKDNNLEKSYVFESQIKEQISVYAGIAVAEAIETIRNKISSVLPEYMIPSFFIILSDLPLTLNGKIDSKLLLALDIGKRVSINEYVPPRNEIEEKLCEIWKEILRLDKIGIHDNFFKIGGTSITAIKVVKLSKTNGFNIKVADIFTNTTIASLSNLIASNRIYDSSNKDRSIIVNFCSPNEKQPLFMIHPGFCGCEVYGELSKKMNQQYCCYGIDSYNLYADNIKYDIGDLSTHYVSQIEKTISLNKDSKLTFLGWSLGGRIALEIASILEKKGFSKIDLILLDTVITDNYIISELSTIKVDDHLHHANAQNLILFDNAEKAKDLINAEIKMNCQKFAALLNNTNIKLVKAMLPHSAKEYKLNMLSNYISTLEYNNIETCVTNIKNIEVIKAFDADHWNIVNKFCEMYK
jgi:thioesterase domain-containing protein/aryl carrier-like protein